jgi:hypothetical protein
MNIEWHAAYLPDDKKFNRPEEMVRGLVSQICDDLMLNRWIPWLDPSWHKLLQILSMTVG